MSTELTRIDKNIIWFNKLTSNLFAGFSSISLIFVIIVLAINLNIIIESFASTLEQDIQNLSAVDIDDGTGIITSSGFQRIKSAVEDKLVKLDTLINNNKTDIENAKIITDRFTVSSDNVIFDCKLVILDSEYVIKSDYELFKTSIDTSLSSINTTLLQCDKYKTQFNDKFSGLSSNPSWFDIDFGSNTVTIKGYIDKKLCVDKVHSFYVTCYDYNKNPTDPSRCVPCNTANQCYEYGKMYQ